jgi:large subunit ribosomal protein L3
LEKPRILGFAGFKVGMTHAIMIDDIPNSPTYGMEISVPVTVVETPPMKVHRVVLYGPTSYGKKILKDGKEVRLILSTNPETVSGIPSKKPRLMEFLVGGNFEESLEYANSLVGKEVSISDVFSDGDFIDVAGITKGKGTQGPVKRWGVMIQPAKTARSSKGRHIGTLGPWHPARISWKVPQLGQTGYHQRTQHNLRILKIGKDGGEITPKGGWLHYGVVRNPYVLIKGSVPGPVKRLLKLRPAIRSPSVPTHAPKIVQIA